MFSREKRGAHIARLAPLRDRVLYSKRSVNAGGNVFAFHQQVLFAMHILLGNQRRVAFLSAALKGKVGPIRATHCPNAKRAPVGAKKVGIRKR